MIPPELKFHHRYLVNGEMTPGDWDQSALEALLQPHSAFLQKKTVLDVGTLDGKWAFWAEDQGASLVDTCDPTPQPTFQWARNERGSRDFRSRYIWQFECPVETVSNGFNHYHHIIDFGVYYHVHDIVGHFQALKKLLVQSPDSRVFVEGEVTLNHSTSSTLLVEFYPHGYPPHIPVEQQDPTTYWVPTVAALRALCEFCGLVEAEQPLHVYSEARHHLHSQGRAFGILKHAQ